MLCAGSTACVQPQHLPGMTRLCGCARPAGLLERIFAVPNPKRRHSKARSSKRRAHDFLTATGVSECPNCHERKLPHHACAKCGTYKGRAVLETKEVN